MTFLKQTIVISLICINISAAIAVLFLINRGLEPSDTGHYYSALFHLGNIKVMTTQFAVIWSLFPIPNEILLHRIVTYFVFAFSCLLFVYKSRELIFGSIKKHTFLSTIILVSVSLAAMTTSYREWVPDPNYNILGQVIMLLLMSCVFHLYTNRLKINLLYYFVVLMSGCLFLYLFLTRPPSGLATLLIILTLFLLFFNANLSKFLNLSLLVIAGSLLGLILITMFVESPFDTLRRVQNGLVKRDLLGFDSGLKNYGFSYLLKLMDSVYTNLPSLLLTIIGVSLVSFNSKKTIKPISSKKLLKLNFIGEILVIIGLLMMFYQLIENRKGYLLVLSLILIIISFSNVIQSKDDVKDTWLRITIFCVIGFLLSISSVIGTVGSLMEATHKRANIFIFFSIGIVVIALINQKQKWLVSTFLLAITAAGTVHSLKSTVKNPYRLPATLLAQKYSLDESTIGANLKVDKQSFEFFSAFYKAHREIQTMEQKPVLIDLTGRMPLIQSFIGAKPARTPWLLSKKSGSNKFFAYIVDQLSSEELESAWILYAPNYSDGLDTSVLANKGINLETNYNIITNTFSPMLEQQILLLRPKTTIEISTK